MTEQRNAETVIGDALLSDMQTGWSESPDERAMAQASLVMGALRAAGFSVIATKDAELLGTLVCPWCLGSECNTRECRQG